MNASKRIAIILTSAFLAACQMKTGGLKTGGAAISCSEINKMQAIMTWEVFGDATKAENCPGSGILERYKLKNGYVSYQVAPPNNFFLTHTEETLRDSMEQNKAFRSSAKTIPIHTANIHNGQVFYSVKKVNSSSGGQEALCAHFRHKFDYLPPHGYRKSSWGTVCDSASASEDSFREEFEKRLTALTERAVPGQRQSSGLSPFKLGDRSENALSQDSNTALPGSALHRTNTAGDSVQDKPDREICSVAVSNINGTIIGWDQLSSLSGYVDEAKRRSLSLQQCATILGAKITKTATAQSTSPKLDTSKLPQNEQPTRRSEIYNRMEQAKSECEALGFKPATEKFGECVLKLSE